MLSIRMKRRCVDMFTNREGRFIMLFITMTVKLSNCYWRQRMFVSVNSVFS